MQIGRLDAGRRRRRQRWLCRPAAAQKTETIRLTIGSSHPPVIPWVLAMRNTVVQKTNKALEAKGSKYRIQWNEAYGGVLYNFENTIEAIEQGIADFGWVGTLWEPAKMPLQNIMFATPFVDRRSRTIAVKVMDELMEKNEHFKKEWESQNAIYFSATTLGLLSALHQVPGQVAGRPQGQAHPRRRRGRRLDGGPRRHRGERRHPELLQHAADRRRRRRGADPVGRGADQAARGRALCDLCEHGRGDLRRLRRQQDSAGRACRRRCATSCCRSRSNTPRRTSASCRSARRPASSA